MALSRQDLPVIDPATEDVYGGVSKGAYVLEDADEAAGDPDRHGLGSVAVRGRRRSCWRPKAFAARVVSMPSWEIFDEQSAEYKASVLPAGVPKLAVEAGAPLGWWKYVGTDGDVIGLDRFGASAPGPKVLEKLGFTAANVAARAKKLVKK